MKEEPNERRTDAKRAEQAGTIKNLGPIGPIPMPGVSEKSLIFKKISIIANLSMLSQAERAKAISIIRGK